MCYEDPNVRNYFQQQFVKTLTDFNHNLDFPDIAAKSATWALHLNKQTSWQFPPAQESLQLNCLKDQWSRDLIDIYMSVL